MLAKTANLDLPLVDEVAADIFMGEFSNKLLAAAKIASSILKGTIYERYYSIDFDIINAIGLKNKQEKNRFGFRRLIMIKNTAYAWLRTERVLV